MRICYNIGHSIFMFLANQEFSSPLFPFELFLGYSWCSYQDPEAWKNFARNCKIRKTDSEDYKREHCVLSLQDFIAPKPKWRSVFENRRLLAGSKLQVRDNTDRRVLELRISHGPNFKSYLSSTMNYLSLMEQNEETLCNVLPSLKDNQTQSIKQYIFAKSKKDSPIMWRKYNFA